MTSANDWLNGVTGPQILSGTVAIGRQPNLSFDGSMFSVTSDPFNKQNVITLTTSVISGTVQTVTGSGGTTVTTTSGIVHVSSSIATTQNLSYSPVSASAWSTQAPTSIQTALDQLSLAVIPTIVGQNPYPASHHFTDGTLTDDTPKIQAAVNAHPNGGVLRLTNVVMLTKVDFSSWNGIGCRIILQGVNWYKANAGELEPPSLCSVDGIDGGGSPQGGYQPVIQGNSATFSPIDNQQPPAQRSTNAFISGSVKYMYQITNPNIPATNFSASYVGCPFNITNVGFTQGAVQTMSGTYTFAGAVKYGNGSWVRIVWEGPNALAPSGIQASLTWSMGGPDGTITGSYNQNGQSYGFQVNTPVFKVQNANTVDRTNCYKQWAALTNCSSSYLNQKLHRIMGASGSNSYYINAVTPDGKGISALLPDYGIGGTSGSPTITSYQATPSIRVAGSETSVRNIVCANALGPGFCLDGNGAGPQQNMSLYNVGASAYPGGTFGAGFVPIIIDGIFWTWVEGAYISNSNAAYGNVERAVMLLTVTDSTQGQYCGIGRYKDFQIQGDNVMIRSEGSIGCAGFRFENFVQETSIPYPGSDASSALVYVDPWYQGTANLSFIDCVPYAPFLESIRPWGPKCNAPAYAVKIDNGAHPFTIGLVGPQMMSASIDILGSQDGVNVYGFHQSFEHLGVNDLIENGRNDDFHPTLVLPYQMPLPDLRDPSFWNSSMQLSSGGVCSASIATGPHGIGPDGSVGRMIQISGTYGTNFAITSYSSSSAWSLPSMAVGDVWMTFIRARSLSGEACNVAAGPFANIFGFNIDCFTPGAQQLSYLGGNGYGVGPVSSAGDGNYDKWQDIRSVHTVLTTGSGGPYNLTIYLGSNGSDQVIIDPESLCILRIPAGTMSQSELYRIYRKHNTQIVNATVGDVAVPSRTGLSFGQDARIINKRTVTTTRTPTAMYTVTAPSSSAFMISGQWAASAQANVTASSGGAFNLTAFNNNGTITAGPLNTVGSLFNCGVGGAASSTPITLSSGSNTLTFNGAAQTAETIRWVLTIDQTQIGGRFG